MNRRNACVVALSALLAGLSTSCAAQEGGDAPRIELCDYAPRMPTINVSEHFSLRNNKWADREADGCIFFYADGRFGWTWDRAPNDPPNYQPNYPAVKWGTLLDYPASGTTDLLPIRIGDIDTLTGRIDARTHIDEAGFKHNSNIEIWTSSTSELIKDDQSHEIMIMFDLSRTDDEPIEASAVTSGGRVFDYHVRIDEQLSTKHTFHIFRQRGSTDWPDEDVDIKAFFDYVIEISKTLDKPFTEDHWLANIMVGNEIWDGSQGRTDIEHISWSLNGVRESAGADAIATAAQ